MAEDKIQSVEKAFKIIELLSENECMGVREIQVMTGINPTTVYRMLNTLLYLGYVRQIEENSKYALTYKFAVLGNKIMEKNEVVACVHPYLKKLSEACNETVHFVEKDGYYIRYLDKIVPRQGVVAMGSYVGMELPMSPTAVGKAILSELKDEEIREIWNKEKRISYTKNTIMTFDGFMAEIKKVRSTGFAYDNEEREEGVSCVAVCIHDYKGNPTYAISISAATNKLMNNNLTGIKRKLIEIKENVTNIIGKR